MGIMTKQTRQNTSAHKQSLTGNGSPPKGCKTNSEYTARQHSQSGLVGLCTNQNANKKQIAYRDTIYIEADDLSLK